MMKLVLHLLQKLDPCVYNKAVFGETSWIYPLNM